MAILLIFFALKGKIPRIITTAITAIAIIIFLPFNISRPFETYNSSFIEENNITFVGEPYVSLWSGEAEGNVEIIKYEGGYNFKISGLYGKKYQFVISDDENEYEFEYYFDDGAQTVVVYKK